MTAVAEKMDRHEEYGISILNVKVTTQMMSVTSVPWTPADVKGVINLRGKVIPMLDLTLRFSIEPTDDTRRICIIVVELSDKVGNVVVRIVGDTLSEILN